DREELLGMNVMHISRTVDQNAFKHIWRELKQSHHYLFEGVHYTKYGQAIDVEVNSHFIRFEDQEYTCSIIRDITERKRKEAALRGALMEIRTLKEQLEAENNYLQEEIKIQHNFGEIISNSLAFKRVLLQIEQVADTTSTVLVTGESGTGKELIARALHQLSRRKNRPMIKVNCAALPANLVESELFGHEKGAFTGALSRKIGKFELANGGTLFLDEIGEMPMDMQTKLLRVLQESEIERVGGNQTIEVDVRIIVATNRNLQVEIEKGQFREDLFYRLNVFPIHSLPLRERKEDIPLLVRFFCEKLGTRLGRHITDIPQKVLDRLLAYDFPGNIRELENLIERAIIVSKDGKLSLGDWFKGQRKRRPTEKVLTLEEVQRKHITDVLKSVNWRVSGPGGAAEILDVRPTTLRSKMEKLKIRRSNEAKG
ncbi:MAG: sigma 54-interacting transcriptional regulator, partial [Bacteroidota bacterium]